MMFPFLYLKIMFFFYAMRVIDAVPKTPVAPLPAIVVKIMRLPAVVTFNIRVKFEPSAVGVKSDVPHKKTGALPAPVGALLTRMVDAPPIEKKSLVGADATLA
jgi:hypothetical protein